MKACSGHAGVRRTHLRGSRCIQDQIRQLPEQFVKGALQVSAGQHRPTQVCQQPGGQLPLAGFGLQRQGHRQQGHLAAGGPQVEF